MEIKKSVRNKIAKILMARRDKIFSSEKYPDFSDRAIACEKVISASGSNTNDGQKIVMRGLAEILLGEKIPSPSQASYIRGAMLLTPVVPIKNIDSHSYTLEQPALMITEAGLALRLDGTIGNTMPAQKEALRAPTDREIKDFVDAMTSVTVEKYFDFVNILDEELAAK